MKEKDHVDQQKVINEKKQSPHYKPPRVTTYTSEEILEAIGPAQACSPSPCAAGN